MNKNIFYYRVSSRGKNKNNKEIIIKLLINGKICVLSSKNPRKKNNMYNESKIIKIFRPISLFKYSNIKFKIKNCRIIIPLIRGTGFLCNFLKLSGMSYKTILLKKVFLWNK